MSMNAEKRSDEALRGEMKKSHLLPLCSLLYALILAATGYDLPFADPV